MDTVDSVRCTLTGSTYVTEASDLGWPAGHWPELFWFINGNRRIAFQRVGKSKLEEAVIYRPRGLKTGDAYAAVSVHVLND